MSIDAFVDQANKKYGERTVQRLTDAPLTVEAVSTGSLTLDDAIGIGGVPKGRFTELFGKEASGKSTLAYHICANAQKEGRHVLYIDTEQTFDRTYAVACGFNVDKAEFSQPECAEDALNLLADAVESGQFSAVVLDTVAALVPRAELEGEIGDAHVAILARLMGQTLRKTASAAAKAGTVVLFVNQVREKVGVMYGNPEVSPGGRALKFYATVRLQTHIVEQVKGLGEKPIAIRSEINVIKNKVGPPFQKAEIEIRFGQGINRAADALTWAIRRGLIIRNGAWLVWGDQKWQGERRAVAWLESGNLDKFIEEIRRTKS